MCAGKVGDNWKIDWLVHCASVPAARPPGRGGAATAAEAHTPPPRPPHPTDTDGQKAKHMPVCRLPASLPCDIFYSVGPGPCPGPTGPGGCRGPTTAASLMKNWQVRATMRAKVRSSGPTGSSQRLVSLVWGPGPGLGGLDVRAMARRCEASRQAN